jgi:putative membrane protein
MSIRLPRKRKSSWKGLVGGLAGGLVASIAMTQFQNAWTKASEKLNPKPKEESQSESKENSEDEDATMKAAGNVVRLTGHRLSHEQKKKAGPMVHYGFGTAMGALYGLARENAPEPLDDLNRVLCGLGFGTGLFLAADEVAVPALGLSGKPAETPLSAHLYGLASHLVYGVSAEAVRGLARRWL